MSNTIAMNHLPPASGFRPPSPAQALSRPPTPGNGPSSSTNPPTQPPVHALNTALSQSQTTQQQLQNVTPQPTIAQANNPVGANPVQAASTKPKPRAWSWFIKFLRFGAAILASGSIIVFIYYQIRADQRDDRNFEYTARSWNLSVWTAHKDYCDFQLSHDNNVTPESCSVGPPPFKLTRVKRWIQAKTALWTNAERPHVVLQGAVFLISFATGLALPLCILYRWRFFAKFHPFKRFQRSGRFPIERSNNRTDPALPDGTPNASATGYKRPRTNIVKRNLRMKSARYKGRSVEMNLLNDWIDRNTPTWNSNNPQSHDGFGEEKRKDVHVDRVLEEFLRDTMIDLLLTDSRIAELGVIAISRLGNAVRFQESLLDLLNTYYVDLSDEFLSISSTLSETHEEGRICSHEIFSIIAPCWIYEVKKSRTYIAEKVVERVTARKGLTEPHVMRARTEHLIQRTQREWRHKHDMRQVEAQVSQVIRLLTEGTASLRLKERFRDSLFPGSWTTYVEGNRSIISHEGMVNA